MMDIQEMGSFPNAKDRIIKMDAQEMVPFPFAKDSIMMDLQKMDHFLMQKI